MLTWSWVLQVPSLLYGEYETPKPLLSEPVEDEDAGVDAEEVEVAWLVSTGAAAEVATGLGVVSTTAGVVATTTGVVLELDAA